MRERDFRRKLLDWYAINKRDLPWRKTSDPYKIWVSEIILQQTRVNQGLAYYHRFISQFPDIKTLAGASSEQLMKVWEGLGYYSRARHMHSASREIMDRYQGMMPVSYTELLTLKGIGPYTAAAIASIAGNEPYAVVDGNVNRVLTRYLGIYADQNRTAAMKEVSTKATQYLDPQFPGDYNQALMELGALICLPRNPDCPQCPVSGACYAYQRGVTESLPSPTKKKTIPVRYFHYLIVSWNNEVIVSQRKKPGIWHLLYEFPLIEAETSEISPEMILHQLEKIFPGIRITPPVEKSGVYPHQLTHMRILTRFYHINLNNSPFKTHMSYRLVPMEKIRDLPFPRVITRYLEENGQAGKQGTTHDPSHQE